MIFVIGAGAVGGGMGRDPPDQARLRATISRVTRCAVPGGGACPCGGCNAWKRRTGRPRRALVFGADDLEVPVDEDMVRPVDAYVVDFVIAVTQLHDPVDNAPRIGGQRSFRGLIRNGSGDDRALSLRVVRGDLSGLLCRTRRALLVEDHL